MLRLSTAELVELAGAGGGFKISAVARPVPDLVQIATAAAGKCKIVIDHTLRLTHKERLQIATAGQGSVYFDFDS